MQEKFVIDLLNQYLDPADPSVINSLPTVNTAMNIEMKCGRTLSCCVGENMYARDGVIMYKDKDGDLAYISIEDIASINILVNGFRKRPGSFAEFLAEMGEDK